MELRLLLSITLEIIAPVIVMTGVGFFLGWRRIVEPEPVARLYMVVFAPALAFLNVVDAEFSGKQVGQIVLFCCVALVSLLALAQIVSRVLRHDRGMRGAFSNSIILYNSANYGLPVQQQAFGDFGGLVQAIVFIMQSMTAFTLGCFLAASNSPSAWATTKRVLKVPLVWALIIGAAYRFSGFTPADLRALPLVWHPLNAFKLALVPSALLSLGVQLSRVRIHGKVRDISLGTAMRLLIGPLVGLGAGLLLGIQGELLAVLVVSVSFPAAIMSSVLATDFRNHEDYAAATVLVSTVASVVTVTVTIYLAKMYLVPLPAP